jgi:anionic cell wall polymer biosynthesis LytR-Cps2A-Psr (LCP) family protein
MLSNGPQNIDGQTALNLTRARGDAYGSYGFPLADFNRTEHQRQVFAAIKQQLNWKLVLDPRKNGQVFDAFAGNVKTDIELSEVRPLFQLFRSIPDDQLQSIALNKFKNVNLLRNYTTPYGQSALIPAAGVNDYSDIQNALEQLNQ